MASSGNGSKSLPGCLEVLGLWLQNLGGKFDLLDLLEEGVDEFHLLVELYHEGACVPCHPPRPSAPLGATLRRHGALIQHLGEAEGAAQHPGGQVHQLTDL